MANMFFHGLIRLYVWSCMVLYCIGWYFMVLDDLVRSCMVMFGMETLFHQSRSTSKQDNGHGHPPTKGWLPTIPRMVTYHSKSTRRKCITNLKFGTWTWLTKLKPGEVWMVRVSPHLQNGHPPSQIYQREVYYVLQTWNLVHKHNLQN